MNIKIKITELEQEIAKLKRTLSYEDRQILLCRICSLSGGRNKLKNTLFKCGLLKGQDNEWVDVTKSKCPAESSFPRYEVSCNKCKAKLGRVSSTLNGDPLKDKINLKHFFFLDNPNYIDKGKGCPSVTQGELTFECFCGNDNRVDMKEDKFKLTKLKKGE
jgi:hypothetical protein